MADFKDYFSIQSNAYSRYRPEYPQELYTYLANVCDKNDLVWDCATGNGQAARGLSKLFKKVHATDASAAQIRSADGPDNIYFKTADAANSGLMGDAVDLITVAQALHWFDLDKFYGEVGRVLKPNGLLAVWCYGLMAIDENVDPLFMEFYENVAGDYWPKERIHIENGYQDLAFPFDKINCPDFNIEVNWSLDEFLGYLRTWSATTRYIQNNDYDPVYLWHDKFAKAWGVAPLKSISWPLTLIAGRVDK